MVDQSITCPSCGTQIPLTRALRADIEASLRSEFDERERALRDEARRSELAILKREQELEQKQADVDVIVARKMSEERARVVSETRDRLAEEQRLREVEKDRQLADMRRQIDDLRRRAEQGSQQLQGEAGEVELEANLRTSFPNDDITGIAQGVRGADIHQIVRDMRGARAGAILWECKNAKNWSDGWIAKLKADQRAQRADLAVLVTASLPKGVARFTIVDSVIVTDFACATSLAAVLRCHLQQVAQARHAASSKEETLELLYRYLSGVPFRQRVEAFVESFDTMRQDLEQERRAMERSWARRAKQIDAVTFNVSGMYGDLQGLVPALPAIRLLELPEPEEPAA
jgi:hypothetical protein